MTDFNKEQWYQPTGKATYTQTGWHKKYKPHPRMRLNVGELIWTIILIIALVAFFSNIDPNLVVDTYQGWLPW
jgi:hypothetical protein